VQDEHSSLPFWQRPQAAHQRDRVRADLGSMCGGRIASSGTRHPDPAPPAGRQVGRHPSDPGFRRVAVADDRPALPCPGKRLLGDVLRLGHVSRERVRVADEPGRAD
jgi:hypothetical protein